jgi:hypothetical protein
MEAKLMYRLLGEIAEAAIAIGVGIKHAKLSPEDGAKALLGVMQDAQMEILKVIEPEVYAAFMTAIADEVKSECVGGMQ